MTSVLEVFASAEVPCSTIGRVTTEKLIQISVGDTVALNECNLRFFNKLLKLRIYYSHDGVERCLGEHFFCS